MPSPPRQGSKLKFKKGGEVSGKSSSLSFSDLKASLKRKKEEEGNPSKNDQNSNKKIKEDIFGKHEKKLPIFSRPSPNVHARSSKHDKQGPISQSSSSTKILKSSNSTDDKVRNALERKAKLYDQLQRRKTGGLSHERIHDSLIDWDRKEAERSALSDDEESGDASQYDSDDPLTEYEDEFGRTRTVRRSEIPRNILSSRANAEEDKVDENTIIYGPSTSFPVYKPDPVGRAAEMAGSNKERTGGEYRRSNHDHFDSTADVRYRGAGFYQFSQDEKMRKEQMDALHQERQNTLRNRDETQSLDEVNDPKDRKNMDDVTK